MGFGGGCRATPLALRVAFGPPLGLGGWCAATPGHGGSRAATPRPLGWLTGYPIFLFFF
jgi:hypothetical protein